MRKLVASAGLVALGAASVHAAAYAPGYASTDMSQPWSVSATLRGFYDDNYLTYPDNSPAKRSSFGFSVSPSAAAALSADMTDLGARYTFTGYYFDDRRNNQWDYAHQFDGYLSHTFSQRFNIYVADSFVYSAEPLVLDPLGSGLPLRTAQDNLRNSGSITFNAQLTQLLTLVLGYANTYYDYQQEAFSAGAVSYPALLDRFEHTILLNLQWQLSPQTVGVLGYNFGMVDYTADEVIATYFTVYPIPGDGFGIAVHQLKSDSRNSRTHTGYVGVDHTFNPDFTVSLRGGVSYEESYNDPSGYTQWAPYGSLNARYRYGMGSYIDLGFQQQYNQTDVLAYNTSASIVYASINHAFTPQLIGSVTGQYVYSKFNGQLPGEPDFSGKSQNQYAVGLDLAYHFDRHFSADIGYNFDKLDSNARNWNYTRNRVYFGVTAAY